MKNKQISGQRMSGQRISAQRMSAFSSFMFLFAILVVVISVTVFMKGREIFLDTELESARFFTEDSPIASIRSLDSWFETTSKKSFPGSRHEGGDLVDKWRNINPHYGLFSSITQNDDVKKPEYVTNAMNHLPVVELDGTNSYMNLNHSVHSPGIVNSFSVFVVAQANETHDIDVESNDGTAGGSGSRFLQYPEHKDASNWAESASAGVGISFGTNGISFYERGDDYMPAVLVHEGSYKKPTLILMEYKNRTPSLYVNGNFIKAGETSIKNSLYPSKGIGYLNESSDDEDVQYGIFSGYLGEVIIFNKYLEGHEKNDVTNYLMQKWGIKKGS